MSVEFTPSKRGRIIALREEGYSYRDIAKMLAGVPLLRPGRLSDETAYTTPASRYLALADHAL
ncbi:hypothetical protein CVT26_000629 [Gymnopilus dilepis]|uniref:Uncharacterized protein n=1 Tax=Gymnopilus dilepis TaxID=231916 RepID=A0A409Y275_9AGAR|nr:hypothetical protein CVT26_000629 [Gymnopilus dilepis]